LQTLELLKGFLREGEVELSLQGIVYQKLGYRNIFVPCKGEKSWEPGLQNIIIPKVRPKEDRGAITNFALSNSPEEVTKFKYISSPKGSSISSCMGDLVLWIVSIPNQFDPWDVFFVVELVQMLEEECFVLGSEIDDSQPSFILGF